MGLIYYEDRCQTFLVTTDQVAAKGEEKFPFRFARGRKLEISSDVLKEFNRAQTWIEDICICDIGSVQKLEQATYQQSLPSSNLARQYDETFVPPHAIVKACQSLIVLPGGEEERGIRRD